MAHCCTLCPVLRLMQSVPANSPGGSVLPPPLLKFSNPSMPRRNWRAVVVNGESIANKILVACSDHIRFQGSLGLKSEGGSFFCWRVNRSVSAVAPFSDFFFFFSPLKANPTTTNDNGRGWKLQASPQCPG